MPDHQARPPAARSVKPGAGPAQARGGRVVAEIKKHAIIHAGPGSEVISAESD